MSIISDALRIADQHNPLGYFEYEKVKSLQKDSSWLDSAEGKAIKILFNFLYFLPKKFRYKILFMERDINEVLISQNKMLKTLGIKNDTSDFVLKGHFVRELDRCKSWLEKQENMEIFSVNHGEIIRSPLKISSEIKTFLGLNLSEIKMAQAVEKTLYRSKISAHSGQ